MKNFQKELLSISTSISKIAVKIEALANTINGQRIEKNPAESPSSSEATVKEGN